MVVAIGLAMTFAHSLNIHYIIIKNLKNRFRVVSKYGKKISAKSSAYRMSIKSYGDLFHTLKSLPHFFQMKFC